MKTIAPIAIFALLLAGIGVTAWLWLESEPEAPKPNPEPIATKEVTEDPQPRRRPRTTEPSSTSTPSTPTPTPPPVVREEPVKPVESRPTPSSKTIDVRGKLSDSEGGLPDTRVILISAAAPFGIISEGTTSGLEGSEGEFTFTVGTENGKVRAAVVDSGWAVAATDEIDLSIETPIQPVELFANISGSLSAQVQLATFGAAPTPLLGATVSVPSNPLLSALLTHYQTLTGASKATNLTGGLKIEGIPSGSYTFTAAKDGHSAPASALIGTATHTLEWKSSGADQSATFTLTQAGSVRGRIVLDANKLPVAGVEVSLSPMVGSAFASVFTDQDGVFVFENVPQNSTQAQRPAIDDAEVRQAMGGFLDRVAGYTLRATKPATGIGDLTPVSVRTGETTDVGDVALKASAAIFGRVTNAAGEPLQGVTVSLAEGGATRAMGGFADMLRGSLNIGGVSLTRSFFSATTDADGNYRIDPVKAQPEPAPESTEEEPTDSRPRGRRGFQFDGGAASLSATLTGYVQSNQDVLGLQPNESREINFKLDTSGVIVGTIIDNYGSPIVGARVIALPGNLGQFGGMAAGIMGQGNSLFGGAANIGAETKEDGTYRLENINPGDYSVIATHPKFNRGTLEGIKVAAGSEASANLTLKSGSTIYGVYYGADSRPVAGATISCMPTPFGIPQTATTDDSGYFEFNGLRAGSYRLKGTISSGGGIESLMSGMGQMNPREVCKVGDAERKEHNVYDIIPGTTTLRGTVTMDGVPYVGALSVGGGSFSGVAFRQVNTDEDGKFELANVELGSYAFMPGNPMAGMGGRGRNRGSSAFKPLQQVRVTAEKTPYQDVLLEFFTVTIRGVVAFENGAPLPNDTIIFASPVEVKDDKGRSSAWEQIQTELTEQKRPDATTGAFEISGLSPGAYYLTARSRTGGYTRIGPINAVRDVAGLSLILDGGVGSIAATVENFVPRNDVEGFGAFFNNIGTIIIEDLQGNTIQLGSLSGNNNQPDNSVQINANQETGIADFKRDGIPVGTWNITLQVNNYAPVTVRSVTITKDLETPVRFILSPAGDITVQITNSDLSADAAQQLRYTITDSRGQEYKKRFTFLDLMTNMFNPPDPSKQNTFTLKGFPPDTYTFTLDLPGFKTATSKVTVFSNQTATMPVTFTRE